MSATVVKSSGTNGSRTRTVRGTSLAQCVAKVRDELGSDATIVRQREGLTGGVAGFFQKRCFEVEAVAGGHPAAAGAGATAAAAAAAAAHVAGETSSASPSPSPSPVAADFLSLLSAAQGAPPSEPTSTPGAEPSRDDAFRADAFPVLEEDGDEGAGPAVAPPGAVAVSGPGSSGLQALFNGGVEPVRPVVSDGGRSHPGYVRVTSATAPPASEVGFAEPLRETLLARGLSDGLATEVLDATARDLLPFGSPSKMKPLVASAIARRIPIAPLRGERDQVVGFVGAAGSGKTRSVARLAHAYAVKGGARVACVALRPEDGGAELTRLLAPHGVPVLAHEEARAARAAIDRLDDDVLVLVDTPGVSPRAETELRVLAVELKRLALDETHLAVPATLAPSAGRRLLEAGAVLGADRLAITHADEAEGFGGVVELAIRGGVPLSYVGRGTIVEGGMRPAVADELAASLVV